MSDGAKMTGERSYSDLSDSATTFDPEEQFDRDIDERMKGMSKEDAVAKAIQDAYQDFADKTAYEHMQMGDLILKHVASAAIAAADKWDAEQAKGKSMRPLTEAEHREVMNALAASGQKQYTISPGLESAIQDELDHPPASIMEEGEARAKRKAERDKPEAPLYPGGIDDMEI
jgi:hypothetical protein